MSEAIKKVIPKTAIVIPTYNRGAILQIEIEALLAMDNSEFFDIYVIDNNSNDQTQQIVNKYKHVHYLKLDKNYYACSAINQGIKFFKICQKYRFILIMANDVLVDKKTCTSLVKFIHSHPSVGLVGATHFEYGTMLIRTTGHSINSLTSLLINFTDDNDDNTLNHFSSLYLTTAKIYEETGGLDDVLFPMIYEEPDFGERILRLHYQIKCCPQAKIWHPIELDYKKKATITVREDRIYSTPGQAYLFFRNRLLYMSLYVGFFRFLLFYLLINPLIFLYYFTKINSSLRKYALQGFVDGSLYAFTRNRETIKKQNFRILNI